MATSATTTRLSADDLLRLPDGDRFELVDGELVEIPMGAESSSVGLMLGYRILDFTISHDSGFVFGPDCGFQCFPDDPNKVRKPDVSFIRRGRLPGDVIPKGYMTIAPDLAAEVVSPGDGAYEISRKAEEYLAAGIPLVWIINPDTRTVLIYRADGSIIGLREADWLTGESVLPSFKCRVGDLFSGLKAPS
ncbi:MAG: Uma2 family endonuclease [Planctomycetaceae bacterium]|nr:Uma2 family endonuclease [Planctomycetaceae bacterium]